MSKSITTLTIFALILQLGFAPEAANGKLCQVTVDSSSAVLGMLSRPPTVCCVIVCVLVGEVERQSGGKVRLDL